jgi:hypothetical protein
LLDYNEAVLLLSIDFSNTCASVKKEMIYNILTKFGLQMKITRLNEICLYRTYSKSVYINSNQIIVYI